MNRITSVKAKAHPHAGKLKRTSIEVVRDPKGNPTGHILHAQYHPKEEMGYEPEQPVSTHNTPEEAMMAQGKMHDVDMDMGQPS